MASAPPHLLSLERTSLREMAVSALRNAITLGTLAPGQHLAETQLSEDLGISRGTLREAMRELQREGLVVVGARGRAYVPSLTDSLIEDTFTLRNVLESAAAIAISNRPDKSEAIKVLKAKLSILRYAESLDVIQTIDADLDLHREICRQSQNSLLLTHWEMIASIIRMSILHAGDAMARANMAADRHQPLVDVLEDGDPETIRSVFSEHNITAMRTILGAPGIHNARD